MTEAATTTTDTTTAPPASPSDSLITTTTAALDFTNGKPEGFPDEFYDVEKKAPLVDKIFKEYTTQKQRAEGLRVKLSKGEFEGKAPEDIKEYTLELDEKLKPLVPDDDPMMQSAREAAKAAGMPKEQFSKFITPIISKLAEIKAESEKPLSEEEINTARQVEIDKLGPSGQRIVDTVASFIEGLKNGGTFSEAEAAAAKGMMNSAEAARVFNKLRMMAGHRDEVPLDVVIDTNASRSDIEGKMAKAMAEGNEAEYNKFSAMLARLPK